MDTITFLSSVLLPLTENAGEVVKVDQLLGMLEHYFIEAFKMTLPSDTATVPTAQRTTRSPPTTSMDAGEEAKLLAVRAVANFHRTAARRHHDFFQQRDYHPHAALFILELLKSLSGNSQQWFRQLQLDSLEACLAIVEVIGMENVRLCLPGVVSVGARYVHRSHHGKDSSKVCLTALRLLRTALVLSFSSAEPAAWMRDTVAHLTGTLRSFLEPTALVRGAFGPPVVVALESLVSSLLVSPGITDHLSSPLGSLLVVAFAVVTNMDHLHHLGESAVEAGEAETHDARRACVSHSAREAREINAVVRAPFAVAAVRDALQCLRGVELLHVATTAVRHPVLRDCFFPLPTSSLSPRVVDGAAPAGGVSLPVVSAAAAAEGESTVALILSVVRKCVRLVGTEMSEEALYTHRQPRKHPAGVVDVFLLATSGALARLPPSSQAVTATAADDDDDGLAAETIGEQVTNALLDDYSAILQDWDAYAVHPSVLYVLTRLVMWQFHPTHQLTSQAEDGGVVCVYPAPSELLLSGAFEQLWSVVAPPHLWSITEDEDLCNNQQIHHRQVVAATLLRFLTLTADLLSERVAERRQEKASGMQRQENEDARERLYALTLYLVLEKATARGIVHEAAMRCLDAFSSAASEADPMSFLLRHSSLVVDETARAVKEEHLRPAAASVLRGSLAFLEARLTSGGVATTAAEGEDKMTGRFSGRGTPLPAVVRQRLSLSAMSTFFHRRSAPTVSLEAAAQVADFVSSTLHVACDTLYLCSRYDSTTTAEDLRGRRAALALLRDALDVAAYLNFSVPQEALDEEQERHTTSAHTRVRALQAAALDCIFTVLQYCTVHDATAPLAVQTVVRGVTCFLTTNTAVSWAETVRQRLHDAEMAWRRAAKGGRGGRRGGKGKGVVERLLRDGASEEEDHRSDKETTEKAEEEEEEDGEGRLTLPPPPPLDWPWTHYVPSAVVVREEEEEEEKNPAAAVPATEGIELPRSHLHTIYRVYLSLFALLREPMAAFATATTGPGARSGVERRKLSDVPVTPAVFEALSGMEALRLLACDFLLHRMVEEVLPLALLWHERGCSARIPTHTEERLKTATVQFITRLVHDCRDSTELERSLATRCRGFPLLASVAARAEEGLTASAPAESAENGEGPLLVPHGIESI